MRLRTAFLVCLLAAASLYAQMPAAPAFSVDVVDVDSSKLPALQSFSAGRGSDGKWLIVGGRSNGLHLFVASSNGGTTPPPNAFPPTYANQTLYVIDPATRQSWSAPLSSLPAAISDALSANNAQSYTSGGYLYVIGGYGWSTSLSQMITYSTLTAIQLDPTIKAIIAGTPFTSYVQQTSTYYDCMAYGAAAFGNCMCAYNGCPGSSNCPKSTPCPCATGPGFKECVAQGQSKCLQTQAAAITSCISMVKAGNVSSLPTNTGAYTTVTGGGMEKVGDAYLLSFGQDFEGLYSVNEGDYGKWPVNQTYTYGVTSLYINPKPLWAATLYQAQLQPNDPNSQGHRRDLNVVPAAGAGGAASVQALGGVFVPGQDSAYRQPIAVTWNSTASPPITLAVEPYQQYLSQYECAVVPLVDRTSGAQTNILLGGISLYYVDAKTGKLHADTGLPFISALSALTRASSGTWSEFYRVAPITIGGEAALVGTDAKFMLNPSVAASPNAVVYLDAIKQKTLVGWMYGGIRAAGPHPGALHGTSSASAQLFEIWIDPAPPPANYWATVSPAPAVVINANSNTAKK